MLIYLWICFWLINWFAQPDRQANIVDQPETNSKVKLSLRGDRFHASFSMTFFSKSNTCATSHVNFHTHIFQQSSEFHHMSWIFSVSALTLCDSRNLFSHFQVNQNVFETHLVASYICDAFCIGQFYKMFKFAKPYREWIFIMGNSCKMSLLIHSCGQNLWKLNI